MFLTKPYTECWIITSAGHSVFLFAGGKPTSGAVVSSSRGAFGRVPEALRRDAGRGSRPEVYKSSRLSGLAKCISRRVQTNATILQPRSHDLQSDCKISSLSEVFLVTVLVVILINSLPLLLNTFIYVPLAVSPCLSVIHWIVEPHCCVCLCVIPQRSHVGSWTVL